AVGAGRPATGGGGQGGGGGGGWGPPPGQKNGGGGGGAPAAPPPLPNVSRRPPRANLAEACRAQAVMSSLLRAPISTRKFMISSVLASVDTRACSIISPRSGAPWDKNGHIDASSPVLPTSAPLLLTPRPP